MDIKAKMKFGVKGYYSLKKLNARGDTVDEGSIKTVNNTVSTAGAISILSGGQMLFSTRSRVGTGTTELTANSPDLTSPVATYSGLGNTSRAGSETDNGDGTSTLVLTREMAFPLGALVGTFSEVGIYYGSVYIAGQLIKDEFGNPTTITVLADEQLVITYTLEWTVPNKSTLLATGTLTDAASNTYNYELWGQPYFRDYLVGSTNTAVRNGAGASRWYSADGTHGGALVSSTINSSSASGNTFTRTVSTGTIPPNGNTFENACFFSFGEGTGSSLNLEGGVTAPSSGASAAPVVMKLLTPMTKTDQESFSLTVSVEYTL